MNTQDSRKQIYTTAWLFAMHYHYATASLAACYEDNQCKDGKLIMARIE